MNKSTFSEPPNSKYLENYFYLAESLLTSQMLKSKIYEILVKMDILLFLEPNREGVRKSLMCKFVVHHFQSLIIIG